MDINKLKEALRRSEQLPISKALENVEALAAMKKGRNWPILADARVSSTR